MSEAINPMESGDDDMTLTLFPPGTVIFHPDDIHRVVIQFPDADSAVLFTEWVKQLFIDTERRGYS